MSSMTTREVVVALLDYRGDAAVEAVTPHGTYAFNVVNVEGHGFSGPVLRLVEVEDDRPSRFERIAPGAR